MDASVTERASAKWAVALHLSVLAGYALPLAGFIAPILIWQLKRHDLPALDAHGRIVANWLLTLLVFTGVCWLLVFALIGFPLLWVLMVVSVAFPIIGAIKAGDGVAWVYPGSMPIF